MNDRPNFWIDGHELITSETMMPASTTSVSNAASRVRLKKIASPRPLCVFTAFFGSGCRRKTRGIVRVVAASIALSVEDPPTGGHLRNARIGIDF